MPTNPAITFDTSHAPVQRRAPSPSPDSRSSSRGVSLDLPHPSPGLRSPRRNRSALRQFYGLQAEAQVQSEQGDEQAKEDGAGGVGGKVKEKELAELDRDDFVPEAYVQRLVETAELKDLLRRENELVTEIRGFDGERKALVYDNYSKLITATDTIRKMRANMEPLAPTTSTLNPAIAHIAQVSNSLVQTIPASPMALRSAASSASNKKNKEAVAWALSAPGRMEELIKGGKKEEAERVWRVVEVLLEKWEGVRGVEELRERGRRALGVEEAELVFE